jgi:glycosyltransferase involved in cell wall biosynthesis
MMRIILVAPVEETVPPAAYGGIEQIVHLLDYDLTARGHQVTLLASGGSSASSRLVPLAPEPLGKPGNEREVASFRTMKDRAARAAAAVIADERPDVVLNHSWRVLDYLGPYPSLTTVHFPLDAEPYRSVFLARRHATYISISNAQRRGAPGLVFAGTVHNGIDVAAFPYSAERGNYLAFLGRVSPEKGLDIAIRVAQTAGIPLRVAAKLDVAHRNWFQDVITPLARRGGVEFLGEIPAYRKGPFLAGAAALLHPSRWSEPFGLAAVEAMACGTPVLALNRGAASEIVGHGRTGFVADDEAGLVSALDHLEEIDRPACREHAASRFGRRRMAEEYERLAIEARSGQTGSAPPRQTSEPGPAAET